MAFEIRSVIKITGMAIATVIGIGVPLAYTLDELRQARFYVGVGAESSAGRIARAYAETGAPDWRPSPAWLEEILAERPEDDKQARQSVIGLDGAPIFQENLPLDSPVLARQAPINLGGETVAWLQSEETQLPLIQTLGLVASVSGIFGILAFLGFRVLPLRVLDRTLSSLESTNRALSEQQVITDSALNNMSQGLCVFDAEKRLVICNRRYAVLYDLPPELTQPGTPLEVILAHRARAGTYGANFEGVIASRLARAAGREQHTDVLEQSDGRAIEILHDPLPDGGWVATHEDVTRRRESEVRIAYLASHDALTDLPNRVQFREKLAAAFAGVARGSTFAIHYLDLDRFKDVNDTLGHPVGDALLRQVARRLRDALAEDAVVARLGGDEFAIIQSGIERPEEASALAARIIQVVEQPYAIEEHELLVGTSIGVALAPADGSDPDQLLKNADLALYRAKAEGRGAFHFFEQEMDNRLQTRRLLEVELRSALRKGELELYYQPVFDVAAQWINGFEALIRWNHPTRGIVPPLDFIPLAEETGLIIPIGEWVIRQACAEAAKWPAYVSVAVNLSAVQFKSPNLVAVVANALAAARLNPSRLELEVTESVLLQESASTLDTLHQLHGLGSRIAMDDFGTGYSSLSYLRSFPFDRIKIDRSFVRELATKQDCIAIVHAIAELARNLGMSTTAEGVETKEHLSLLAAEGCTEIQGYLISAPKPAADVPGLLARYRGDASRETDPAAEPQLKRA